MKYLLALSLFVFSNIANAVFPDDFSDVVWLDPDISSWPETANLTMSVDSNFIHFNSDKRSVWPRGYNRVLGNSCCNANAWIFIKHQDVWYAVTFEYLSLGQSAKDVHSVNGAWIKRAPFFGNGFTWSPINGEVYGFMVSGMARFGFHSVNIAERSQVSFYQWGVGPTTLTSPKPDAASIAPIMQLLLD